MSFAIIQSTKITVYPDKAAFVSNGTNYPRFWYVGANDQQREEAGCKKVIYENMADESLYWNAEKEPYYDASRNAVIIDHINIEMPVIVSVDATTDTSSTTETITISSADPTISLNVGTASDTISGGV